MTTADSKAYKVNKQQQSTREKLIALGFRPSAAVDYSGKGGHTVEFFTSSAGNVLRVTYSGGKAIL